MSYGRARPRSHVQTPEPTQLIYAAVATAGLIVVASYIAGFVVPTWSSYSRLWERLAATGLTLVILVTLVAVGVACGLAVLWLYVNSA